METGKIQNALAGALALDHQSESLRMHLQQELVRRCEKNPKYSLRAYAKSLGIQAPTLSHILRGTRPLSRKKMISLCERLGILPEPLLQQADELNRRQLTLDSFTVISDWYHFAILELVSLKSFQPNPKWIAKVLGISVNEVNIALERLVRLELLEIGKKRWRPTSAGNTTIGSELTTVALRKVQKQFLEKALTALEEVPANMRDQSGATFCVDLKDLPAIKEEIKNFRRQLMKRFEKNESGGGDEVYQLSTSFFPLTKTQGENK